MFLHRGLSPRHPNDNSRDSSCRTPSSAIERVADHRCAQLDGSIENVRGPGTQVRTSAIVSPIYGRMRRTSPPPGEVLLFVT
jgi:hypothetical protein